MKHTSWLLFAVVLGCSGGGAEGGHGGGGGPADTVHGREVRTAGGEAVTAAAHEEWRAGIALFQRYEHSGWNEDHCTETSEQFGDANEEQGGHFAEALFMQGLSLARCHKDSEAQAFYNRALEANPKFCKARAAIGVAALDAGRGQEAFGIFQRAIRDDAQCTEAYVNIAALQRQQGGANVREALQNLRRALAIDAQYLPAFNQMALLYLDGAATNPQMLDLAGVVCRQAQQINRNYAPVYNTWGLINLRKGDIIEALRMFTRARELDNHIFEAHMNFGQITLSFRGNEDAKAAFERAIQLRPRDYDAHIGLGVALRGLNHPDQAEAQYNAAKELDGGRPEAYFNLGILYQDYKGGQIPMLERARGFFNEFLGRAGANQKFASAVEEIRRRCQIQQQSSRGRGRQRRQRLQQCRPGRLQNIEIAIEAQRMMQRGGNAAGGAAAPTRRRP